MILEQTQILHTSLRQHGFEASWMYKSFNSKHPSCLWASESRDNFNWLVKHGKALCAEYTKRYGKHHKCYSLIDRAEGASVSIPNGEETPIKLAMPTQFMTNDAVHSYRLYYAGAKYSIASWKTSQPYWWDTYRSLVKSLKLEVSNDKNDGVNI